MPHHFPPLFCCATSLLVASCSSSVSTSADGSCTYLITEPRMKQFFTDCCGARASARVGGVGRRRARWAGGRAAGADARGAHHVRIILDVVHAHVEQLDVQVLVHRVQRAAHRQVVLQLDDDLLADERLEEGVEELRGGGGGVRGARVGRRRGRRAAGDAGGSGGVRRGRWAVGDAAARRGALTIAASDARAARRRVSSARELRFSAAAVPWEPAPRRRCSRFCSSARAPRVVDSSMLSALLRLRSACRCRGGAVVAFHPSALPSNASDGSRTSPRSSKLRSSTRVGE